MIRCLFLSLVDNMLSPDSVNDSENFSILSEQIISLAADYS